MEITDEQYCKLTGRGGIIKLIDEDNFKPEVYCKAIYQDAPEIDLEIMIIGNQSKDNRFILVGVKDNYRADYPEPRRFLLEKIDNNLFRIHTRRFHKYPFDDPVTHSLGNKSSFEILKDNGTLRVIGDKSGYYWCSYDAIIENKDNITCDYVGRFYNVNNGDLGLIYLWEESRIAIVKRIGENIYKSVEYLDEGFLYSFTEHEFRDQVVNEEEGYIEFDLYLTYTYPGSRLDGHRKYRFKIPD